MQVIAQKRSFVEVITFQQPKTRLEWFNPLKTHVLSKFNFNKLDWDGMGFSLSSAREYTRVLDGKTHVHVAYDLVCRQPGQDLVKARLLALPVSDDVLEGFKGEVSCVLLSPEDEMEYSDELWDVIQKAQEQKLWIVTLDGEEDGLKAGEHKEIQYKRIHDLSIPFEAEVAVLKKKGDGDDYTANDVTHESVTYWDYWREMVLEGGVQATEFFIIEMNNRTKQIYMWRGTQINQDRISVI